MAHEAEHLTGIELFNHIHNEMARQLQEQILDELLNGKRADMCGCGERHPGFACRSSGCPCHKNALPNESIDKNRCRVCETYIAMMAFKGTGYCCENHRKQARREWTTVGWGS